MTNPHPQKIKCGAKNKQGKPCELWAMKGRRRCRLHGGATPRGIESANFKHGRYSQHMPKGIGALAIEASNDPDLFNLRDLIGVYEARIKSALNALDKGGGLERMEQVIKVWGQFRTAWGNKQAGTVQAAIAEMDLLLVPAEHDVLIWKDVDVAAKNLKLLMESERKRAIESAKLIPVIKASGFARELLLAVRQEVVDPEVWARVQARATELLGDYPAIIDGEAEEADYPEAVEGELVSDGE